MVCLYHRSTMKWTQPEVTVVYIVRTESDAPPLDVMRRLFPQAAVVSMKVRFADQQPLAAGAVSSPSTNIGLTMKMLAVDGDSDVIKLARLFQIDTYDASC